MKRFDALHPAASAFYFISVIIISVFASNPILQATALAGGISFCAAIKKGGFLKELLYNLILFLIVCAVNPLFVHNGETPLFFINGNAFTLEAVFCGGGIAAALMSAIYWFKCFNVIMTSDKLLYLFSKFSSKISLLLSSALRFIPVFKAQSKKIRATQTAMGMYYKGGITDKVKSALRVYSALISWALENAIDTASSMKSRGYGLKGRTHFALFRFSYADGLYLIITAALDVIVLFAMSLGALKFEFYPRISEVDAGFLAVFAYTAFAFLAFLPIFTEVMENIRWKFYKSRI